MKTILFLLFCFLLSGCTNCNPAIQPKEERERLDKVPPPSLQTFIDTLKKQDPGAPGTIDHALRLFSMLAPNDSTGADSAAAALMGYIQQVLEKENQALVNDTIDLSPLLDPTGPALGNKLQSVRRQWIVNRLKPVSDGEGGVYIVPAYELFLSQIQAKTSQAVDSYLDLVAEEDTAATFKDAGLAIEITEMVDRLVVTEQLQSWQLPKSFAAEAARLNGFYSYGLIRGSDNSPSIDYGKTTLTDRFKKGYDYLLATYPSSKAAVQVREWLAVVRSGDKPRIDAYRQGLE